MERGGIRKGGFGQALGQGLIVLIEPGVLVIGDNVGDVGPLHLVGDGLGTGLLHGLPGKPGGAALRFGGGETGDGEVAGIHHIGGAGLEVDLPNVAVVACGPFGVVQVQAQLIGDNLMGCGVDNHPLIHKVPVAGVVEPGAVLGQGGFQHGGGHAVEVQILQLRAVVERHIAHTHQGAGEGNALKVGIGQGGALADPDHAFGNGVAFRGTAHGIDPQGGAVGIIQHAVHTLEVPGVLGHPDILQAGAVAVGAGASVDAAGAHAGGQGDLLQSGAAGEGQGGHLRQTGAQVDIGKGNVVGEGAGAQIGDGIGQVHGLQLVAGAEHADVQGGGAVGQLNGLQGIAVVEGVAVDGQAVGGGFEHKLRNLGAGERIGTDVGDAGVDGDLLQGGVVLEHLGGDLRHVGGYRELRGGVGHGPQVQLAGLTEDQDAVSGGIYRVGRIHRDVLQPVGVVESVLVDIGYAGGQVNFGDIGGLVVVQVGEGLVADGLQGLGEHQAPGLVALIERVVADGFDLRAGQIQILGRPDEVERVIADGLKLRRPVDIRQVLAVVEGVGADGGHVIAHGDGGHGLAVVERPVGNLRQAAAVDGLGGVAVVERVGAKLRQGGRQEDGGGLLTAVERVLADGGDALGDGDGGGHVALIESVVANGFHRIRQDNGSDFGNAVEGIGLHGGQALAQIQAGQGGAVVECVGAHGGDAVRQVNGGELGATVESVRLDGLQAVGEGDGGQGGIAVEGAGADDLNAVGNGVGGLREAAGQGDELLAVAAEQSAVHHLQGGAALGNDDALEAGAAHERLVAHGQIRPGIGGGEGNGFQRRAVLKGVLADGADVVWHHEVHQGGTLLEHGIGDGGEIAGDGGQGHVVAEHAGGGGDTVGGGEERGAALKVDGLQNIGVGEAQAADSGDLGGNGDAGSAVQMLEAGVAQGGDILQIRQLRQAAAAREAVLGQFRQAGGEIHAGQAVTAAELVAVGGQLGDGIGHGDAGDCLAATEGVGANGGNAVGNDQVALQGIAEVEAPLVDFGQALGDHALVLQAEGLQLFTAVEGPGRDGLHVLRQGDGEQVVAVIEGLIADDLQGIRHDHMVDGVVVIEGALGDLPDAVGNHNGLLAAAVAHQHIAVDGEAAGAAGELLHRQVIAGGGVTQNRGGGDDAGACGQAGDGAGFIHRGDGFIGGTPGHLQIGGGVGGIGGELGGGVGIPNVDGQGGAVQGKGLHGNLGANLLGHGDGAGSGDIRVVLGLHGDGGGAGGDGLHQAVLNLGNGGVGGGPDQRLVGGVVGGHNGVKLDVAPDGQGHLGGIQGDGGDGNLIQGDPQGALVEGVVIGQDVEGAVGQVLVEVGDVEGIGIRLVGAGHGTVLPDGGGDAVIVVLVGLHAVIAVHIVGPVGGVQGGAGQGEVIRQHHVQIHPAVLAVVELQVVPVHHPGHLGIGGEVEGVGVVLVLLDTVIIQVGGDGVIHPGAAGDVDAVTHQSGPDIAHIAGPYGAAAGIIVGLPAVDTVHGMHNLAGIGVGDGHLCLLGATELASHQVIEVADAVAGAQIQGGPIPAGFRLRAALGDVEGVDAQGEGVHHGVHAGGGGGVHLHGLAVVVIRVLEDGSLGPVAVEGQIGNGQGGIIVIGQLHEALHIDAVFKIGVHVILGFLAQLHGDDQAGLAVGGNRQHIALQAAAGDPKLGFGIQDEARLGDEPAVGGDGLGLHQGIDGVAYRRAGQVLHLEGQVIDAGAAGIVPQLDLGLVAAPDVQVGGGVDGARQIHHAGALTAGRVGHAAAVIDDVGGAHQQPVHQRPLGVGIHAGEALAHILHGGGGNAGHIGAGHGGAAHVAVLAEGQGGIDGAAGGGDLRLQLQGGQGAPGGEVAHGDQTLAAGGDGQGLILLIAHHDAVGVADADGGDGIIVHGHIQQVAVPVVVDDAAHGSGGGGVELLVVEAQVASDHHGDLAGDVDILVVGGFAVAGNHHIFKGSAFRPVQQQAGEVMAGHVVVGNILIPHGEGAGGIGIDGGRRQGGVIGSGRAGDAGVRIGGAGEVALGAAVAGGIGVAAGGVQQNAAGLHGVVIGVDDGAVRLGAKAAGGAQGHIDHVHAQQNGVVQGRQDGVGGGAVGAVGEHLEDGKLGLGGLTGEGHVAVFVHGLAGGDARHMGAVIVAVALHGLGAGNDVGIRVGVVKGEGNLAALVQVVGGQQRQVCGGGVRLGIPQGRIAVSGGIGDIARVVISKVIPGKGLQAVPGQLLNLGGVGEGLVGPVQARVQNADDHAFALEGGVIGIGGHLGVRQGLAQGGLTHHVGIVQLAQGNPADAVQLRDGHGVGVGHFRGEAAGDGGVGIGDLLVDAGLLHLGKHAVRHGLDLQKLLTGGLGAKEIHHGGFRRAGGRLDVQQAGNLQLHDHPDLLLGVGQIRFGHDIRVHVFREKPLLFRVGQIAGLIGALQGRRRRLGLGGQGAHGQHTHQHGHGQNQRQQPCKARVCFMHRASLLV